MTVQWITMRWYIGGSENMAWYRAFLRTDRKRDSKTASDYYCFFVLYISPKEPEQLDAGHCNLLHYPRYPWEQKGSYGSCTGAIEQRCLIAHSQDTSSDGTVQQAETEVRHYNCPTASPSSQGKMFCTLLHDACVC